MAQGNGVYTEWSGINDDFMEWSDIEKANHSTPKRQRPAPTASPNLSPIRSPTAEEIVQLAERLERIHL